MFLNDLPYLCIKSSKAMKIKLTKQEKRVLRHVAKFGKEQPRNITPIMFHFCLSTLSEKGLVEFRSNSDIILEAGLTIKACAYMESNPRLRNPIDWKWIISIILSAIVAIATTLALFVACTKFN